MSVASVFGSKKFHFCPKCKEFTLTLETRKGKPWVLCNNKECGYKEEYSI
jgi:hypothetical protein